MAYKIFPLNDSPIPDSATWSALMSRLAGDGVVSGYNGELAVTAGAGLSVDIDTGAAIVQGVYFENMSAANLALSPADTVDPRIDLVVVRIDYIGGSAQSGLYVLTGTPAASPSAPTPSQIAGQIWEIPLAEIYVAAGATSVSASDITDRHGWVAPVPHADSHAVGGGDPITPAMIGAAPATHASQHAAGGSDPVTIAPSQISPQGEGSGLDADSVQGKKPYSHLYSHVRNIGHPYASTTSPKYIHIATVSLWAAYAELHISGEVIIGSQLASHDNMRGKPIRYRIEVKQGNLLDNPPDVYIYATSDRETPGPWEGNGIWFAYTVSNNGVADLYLGTTAYNGLAKIMAAVYASDASRETTAIAWDTTSSWQDPPAGVVDVPIDTAFNTSTVEYGSNSNGEYVRYPDGTQICWVVSFGMTYNTAKTWTYPAAFAAAPAVAGLGYRGRLEVYGDVNATSANVNIDSSLSDGTHAYLIAVGRWK